MKRTKLQVVVRVELELAAGSQPVDELDVAEAIEQAIEGRDATLWVGDQGSTVTRTTSTTAALNAKSRGQTPAI